MAKLLGLAEQLVKAFLDLLSEGVDQCEEAPLGRGRRAILHALRTSRTAVGSLGRGVVQSERGVQRGLIDSLDPDELVARTLAANDRHARGSHADAFGDQATQCAVCAPLECRRHYSCKQHSLADRDELVTAGARLHADRDLCAGHGTYDHARVV
jgi:hypothetical protein